MQLPDAWIETTYYDDENRTLWVVKVGSEILKVGEVANDAAGTRAYDVACAWARENLRDATFAWKHWQGAVRGR